jgi:Bacterial PH domain
MNAGDAQLRAQSELQSGESLLWTGTADPRRAAITALPAVFFGIPFAGFALFWMNMAYRGTHNLARAHNWFASGFTLFPLFGVPFFLVGVGIVLAPLWAYLKRRNGAYAVTNHRVMIITGTTSRAVKSIMPSDIVEVDHRERPDASGDVLIRTNATVRTNNMTSQITVGLYGIPNVKEVAALVMNLRAQRAAS